MQVSEGVLVHEDNQEIREKKCYSPPLLVQLDESMTAGGLGPDLDGTPNGQIIPSGGT